MDGEKFEVHVQPTAYEDIENAARYIALHHSEEKAVEWAGKLFDLIDTLESMPDRCPLAPENGNWGKEKLHQLLFQEYPATYRVIFTIVEQSVHVLQIRHGSMRWMHES